MSINIDQERVMNKAKETLSAYQADVLEANGAQAPSLEKLLILMDWLRSDDGCPWDREQTIASLEKYVIEEAFEVQAAMRNLDGRSKAQQAEVAAQTKLMEHRLELGDLLLQIIFQSQIQKEDQHFDFEDVCSSLYEKLVMRHPHLFDKALPTLGWEELKALERKQKPGTADEDESALDGVPTNLPPLLRAYRLGERAHAFGFCWPDHTGAMAKVREEVDELDAAISAKDRDSIEDEMGDALYALVNVCRHTKVDPSRALLRTLTKFEHRFRYMERAMKSREDTEPPTLEEMEAAWQAAKNY